MSTKVVKDVCDQDKLARVELDHRSAHQKLCTLGEREREKEREREREREQERERERERIGGS